MNAYDRWAATHEVCVRGKADSQASGFPFIAERLKSAAVDSRAGLERQEIAKPR